MRYARELGRIAGVEGRVVGVNYAFAPIIDIDYNSLNPITNTGSDYGCSQGMTLLYYIGKKGARTMNEVVMTKKGQIKGCKRDGYLG